MTISVRQRELRRQLEATEAWLNTHPPHTWDAFKVNCERRRILDRLLRVQLEEYDPS